MSGYWITALCWLSSYLGWTARQVWDAHKRAQEAIDAAWRAV